MVFEIKYSIVTTPKRGVREGIKNKIGIHKKNISILEFKVCFHITGPWAGSSDHNFNR